MQPTYDFRTIGIIPPSLITSCIVWLAAIMRTQFLKWAIDPNIVNQQSGGHLLHPNRSSLASHVVQTTHRFSLQSNKCRPLDVYIFQNKIDCILFSYVINLKVDETRIGVIFYMQRHGGTEIMSHSDLICGAYGLYNEMGSECWRFLSLRIII